MRFSEAFRETVFRFKLKGSELSEKSGLSTAQISNFRNGHNLRIDSVERLLQAMPPEAREFMLNLVAQAEESSADNNNTS